LLTRVLQGAGKQSMQLQDAPVLYPTPEEFADPVTYIASIEELGKATGIVKIVPPAGWKPPTPRFAEDIPFETKRQRLDKLQVGGLGDGHCIIPCPRFHRLVSGLFRRRVSRMKTETITRFPSIGGWRMNSFEQSECVDCEARLGAAGC
jgi:hypothetical protein